MAQDLTDKDIEQNLFARFAETRKFADRALEKLEVSAAKLFEEIGGVRKLLRNNTFQIPEQAEALLSEKLHRSGPIAKKLEVVEEWLQTAQREQDRLSELLNILQSIQNLRDTGNFNAYGSVEVNWPDETE